MELSRVNRQISSFLTMLSVKNTPIPIRNQNFKKYLNNGVCRTYFSSRFNIILVGLLVFCICFLPSFGKQIGDKIQGSTSLSNKSTEGYDGLEFELLPTVLIAILVRNKAHTLPYFFTLLENLDYPKDRIALWLRSDHNEDGTPEILRKWGGKMEGFGKYHSISLEVVDAPPFRHSDQNVSAVSWTTKRFRHIIRLKEEAMRVAKRIWADYIWFLDADAFIINEKTLRHLVEKKKDMVAPMLVSGGMYSNFWGGMDKYYYVRTEQYKQILDRKIRGCFKVPMIHTSVIINMRKKNTPNFHRKNDSVPEDDIILLASNARDKGISMEICNDLEFGAVLAPLEETTELKADEDQLNNLRVEIAAYWPTSMEASNDFMQWLRKDPTPSTIGFDKVYLINLKRRPDRLMKMKNVLRILGIEYELIDATDGQEMRQSDLDEMGIKPLPEYRDPYSKRTMTFGEIGCFLSHYRVWKKMQNEFIRTALILEDDIRFEPYFVLQVMSLFRHAADIKLDWDMMYLGRKKSANAQEPWAAGSEYIVKADYSYWTLGYAITGRGVKKLIEAEPFRKLLPLDEFLPIIFDRHINHEWKSFYPKRDLKAFSVEPLLLYPTHYTGEIGYVSDTEQSNPIIHVKSANCSKDEL